MKETSTNSNIDKKPKIAIFKKMVSDDQLPPKSTIKMRLAQSDEKLNLPTHFSEAREGKTPMIKIEHLTKGFGSGKKHFIAVNDLNLTINQGENLAFLGANGAGKTTTVEIVAGISKPDKGTIEYLYPYKNSFHEGLGIQFQDSSYPSGLKVKNVIDFMLNVYDVKMSEAEKIDIVEAFDLKELYNRSANSLSGGQQQRLNVLLALIHKPKIIFLDELSTGLDISVRAEIKTFIKEYTKANNITIVLVSHDIEEVSLLCDRIIIMQKGVKKIDLYNDDAIKEFGSIQKLIETYI